MSAYKTAQWWEIDTHNHNYNMGDIRDWPVDASCICSSGTVTVLGSIKAAISLDEVEMSEHLKVTHVVTLCGQELPVRGMPMSLSEYLRMRGVQNVSLL